ncbi:MAG: Holliday junction resolvase RuvX [Pseudomonadota bacterium]
MTNDQTVLAFDFGLARVGVAVGQSITGTATALTTLHASGAALDSAIDTLVRQWRPSRLLVGLPHNDSSSASSIRKQLLAFADGLARHAIPVDLVDESFSSREAEARLKARRQAGARRSRPGDIDAEAARIIAEQWLQDASPAT